MTTKGQRVSEYTNDTASESGTLRFPKPKILLVDMDSATEQALCDAGYNVSIGSFGTPVNVTKSDDLYVVDYETLVLPNYQEQEVVVANITRPSPLNGDVTNNPGDGVSAIWQSAENGAIDPRPLTMRWVQPAFDRILAQCGIAIILLSQEYKIEYVYGSGQSSVGLMVQLLHSHAVRTGRRAVAE